MDASATEGQSYESLVAGLTTAVGGTSADAVASTGAPVDRQVSVSISQRQALSVSGGSATPEQNMAALLAQLPSGSTIAATPTSGRRRKLQTGGQSFSANIPLQAGDPLTGVTVNVAALAAATGQNAADLSSASTVESTDVEVVVSQRGTLADATQLMDSALDESSLVAATATSLGISQAQLAVTQLPRAITPPLPPPPPARAPSRCCTSRAERS